MDKSAQSKQGPIDLNEPGPGRRSLVLGATIGILAEATILPAGLISAAYLTRQLGVEGYGLLSVIFAVVAPLAWIAASLLAGKTALKLILDAANSKQMASRLLRLNFMVGASAWACFAVLSPLIASWLGHYSIAVPLALAGSEILLLPLTRIHRDALIASGSYAHSTTASGIFQGLRLLGIIALVPLGFDLLAVVFAVALARLGEIVWCRRKLAIPIFAPSISTSIPWRSVVSAIFVYELSQQILARQGIIILAAFGEGAHEVGYFGAARVIAMAPDLFALVLAPMLMSATVLARKQRQAAHQLKLLQSTDQLAALGFGLTLSMVGVSTPICTILFGPDFAAASTVLSLLIVGASGALIQAFATAQFFAHNQYRPPLMVAIPLLLVALTISVIVTPRWGANGLAAALAAIQLSGGLISVLMLPRPRRPRLLRLFSATLAGLAGSGAGYVASQHGLKGFDIVLALAISTSLMLTFRVIQLNQLRKFFGSLMHLKRQSSGKQGQREGRDSTRTPEA